MSILCWSIILGNNLPIGEMTFEGHFESSHSTFLSKFRDSPYNHRKPEKVRSIKMRDPRSIADCCSGESGAGQEFSSVWAERVNWKWGSTASSGQGSAGKPQWEDWIWLTGRGCPQTMMPSKQGKLSPVTGRLGSCLYRAVFSRSHWQ